MKTPEEADTVAVSSRPATVDPDDSAGLEHWREHFGATFEQLVEAVQAVGGEPAAVREHLLNQGSSAGAG